MYMKEELPNAEQDKGYVINMPPSSKGTGTHWVSIFIIRNNAYYFNSFGGTPPLEICEFVKETKRVIFIL